MAFHPDSFSIRQYIVDNVDDLVEPIEEIQWREWKVGDDDVDGLKTIQSNFLVLGVSLANTDLDISELEVAMCLDVKVLFTGKEYVFGAPRMVKKSIEKLRQNNEHIYDEVRIPPTVILLEVYDQENGTKYADIAKTMFFRFANSMLKADGTVTKKEQQVLTDFKNLLYTPRDHSDYFDDDSEIHPDLDDEEITPSLPPAQTAKQDADSILAELYSLTGLGRVKDDVLHLVNFLKVQQMRREKGLPDVPVSRHLVFCGNPGTGKTTVARLLAHIYNSLGILSKGHLVETDRSGLVGGYLGQTALKVKEVATSAIGGVLFIDEAYSLTADRDDYGKEAIDTLVKLMEDNRGDLVVIVAGYPDKMERFLLSNPGLKSRFNKHFDFEDYTPEQLVKIFNHFCNGAKYQLSDEANAKLATIFHVLYKARDESFGNARLARNLFERTMNNQANRVIALPKITDAILSTIEAADISDVSKS